MNHHSGTADFNQHSETNLTGDPRLIAIHSYRREHDIDTSWSEIDQEK